MIRRKHRLYIDVVYSKYVTTRDAAKGLQLVLNERLDLQAGPVWLCDNSPYIEKLTIVERRS